MKTYVIALAVGLLVGGIYGLLNVRSPAPPVVALIGLLGILLGEQIVPRARQLIGGMVPPTTVASGQRGDNVQEKPPVAHRRPNPNAGSGDQA